MTDYGEPFGKYELLERVAVGGMAEVWRARTRGAGGFERVVAIKRLHRHLCDDQDLTAMLVEEARLVVQLQHINIAQTFDLGIVDGQYFMVMEYIDGLDMHGVLGRSAELGRGLPTPIILYAMIEMLSGLDYAHDRVGKDGQPLGVVHRDISPQNVMFSYAGEIKLIDFGIAKMRDQVLETQAGIIKGKFFYMSPEQAHGQRLDRRSDIFSVGMVLYELLTGRPAYEEMPDVELLRAVRAGRFKPPSAWRPEIDPELERVVLKALHKDRNQRYQSASELQQELIAHMKRMHMDVSRLQASEFLQSLVQRAAPGGPQQALGAGDFRPDESSLIFVSGDLAMFAGGGGGLDMFDDDEQTAIYQDPQEETTAPSAPAWPETDFDQAPTLQPNPDRLASEVIALSSQDLIIDDTHEGLGPSARRKLIIVGAGAALVLGLIGLVAALWSDEPAPRPAPPEPAVAARAPAGRFPLEVRSQPAGATVYREGAFFGKTPLTLIDLEPGVPTRITLKKQGFEPWERAAAYTSDSPPIEAKLEPSISYGRIRVHTKPPGLRVRVNGEEMSARTPLELERRDRSKTYTVQVYKERDGADALLRERTVRWEPGDGELKTVEVNFEDLALIEAAQEESAARSPKPTARPPRRRPDRRRRSSKPAPKDKGLSVWGTKASSAPKKGGVPEPKKGFLSVKVSGSPKEVRIDDKVYARGRGISRQALGPGKHTVTVKFPDGELVRRTVFIKPGASASIIVRQ